MASHSILSDGFCNLRFIMPRSIKAELCGKVEDQDLFVLRHGTRGRCHQSAEQYRDRVRGVAVVAVCWLGTGDYGGCGLAELL